MEIQEESLRKMASHIKSLDSELQEVFQTYNEVRCIQEGRNRDFLYLQGIKDGLKRMRFLEMV